MSTESDAFWLDDHWVVSLPELVSLSGLSEPEVVELVHHEVLPLRSAPGEAWTFSARVVTVARQAGRLRADLELDVSGLAVALRLLERVRKLEEELSRMRAIMPRG